MRVVHLACVAPPETGGIGRVAFEEVARLRASGIDSELVSLATPGSFRFGNAGMIPWETLEAIADRADIVHLHYPFFGTAERVAALKRRGRIKKLVITFHMDASASGLKGFLFWLYGKIVMRTVLRAADAILVSSKDYAQTSSASGYFGKMIELPFGVDATRFSPGADTCSLFGIPQGVPVVSFVGGMDTAHAFKGVDVLLRAVARIPNTHLLLAGDGDLRPSYETLAKDLGVSDRSHFIGRPTDEQLPDVYRAGQVFAFPSSSSAEAFGLVALEAQASGVPVVASNLAGVRTVIADGETGLLVPRSVVPALQGALESLLTDPARCREMGDAARRRVMERFTWERHMDGLIDVYHKLCASPS